MLMKKHIRKMLQLAAIWMIFLVMTITVAHALSIRFDPNENIAVERNTATITWETDEQSIGSVEYGRKRDLPQTRYKTDSFNPGTEHQVVLRDLAYGTEFGLRIKAIGESVNGEVETIIDDNQGDFYTFNTPAETLPERAGAEDEVPPEEAPAEEQPAELPDQDASAERTPQAEPLDADEATEQILFVRADIPAFIKTSNLVVTGQSMPGATIKLYVNPPVEQSPTGGPGYRALGIALSDGSFRIPLGGLSGESRIVVYAESSSHDQAVTEDYTVLIDPDPPKITVTIPPIVGANEIPVEGETDEDVTLVYELRYAGQGGLQDTVNEVTIPKGPFQISIPAGFAREVLEEAGQPEGAEQPETSEPLRGGNQITTVNLKLTFHDRAQNTQNFEQQVKLFPNSPQILSHNLDQISPSYVQKVTVKGTATPGSTVIAVINGETSPVEAWSLSLLDAIKSLGVRFTPGEPYHAVVGEDGEFEIDVLLTRKVRSQRQAYLPPPHDVSSVQAGFETGQNLQDQDRGQFINTIELLAVDELTASDKTRVHRVGPTDVTFAKCGQGAYWEMVASRPTPSTILPEHLRRGYSMLGFDLFFKWIGPGRKGVMREPPKVRLLPISLEAREDYLFDPQDLVREPIKTRFSSDYTTAGVLVELNQIDYQQKALQDISLKDDLLVEIPMEVEVNFEYEQFGKTIHTTQKNCVSVSSTLDIQVPPDAIPKKLLQGSVDVISNTVEVIDAVLEPLKKIAIFLFVGCLLSWVWLFMKTVSEKMACFGVDKTAPADKQQECNKAKDARRDFEKKMRWICDRTFCPAAPTLERFTKDLKLRQEADVNKEDYDAQDSQCVAETVGKTDLPAGLYGKEPLPNMEDVYNKLGSPAPRSVFGLPVPGLGEAKALGKPASCIQEYRDSWDSSCLGVDELQRSACLYYKQTEKPVPGTLKAVCSPKILDAVSESFCKFEQNKKEGTIVHWLKNGKACGKDQTVDKQPEKKDRYFELKKDSFGYYWQEIELRWKPERVEGDPNKIKTEFQESVVINPRLTKDQEKHYCLTEQEDLEHVVDPTAGLISSVRCACVPAVTGHLQLWKNILTQVKGCFQTILVTGQPNSGLCRAVLTQYVCDLTLDAVKCFAQRYGAGGGLAQDREGVSGFLRAVTGAGAAVQNSIVNRYGRSALYNTLFNERKLVHAACLWAFTGDFDFDLEGALTGVGAMPVQSECVVYPATRRFMASNPVNRGLATYMYHIGAGIAAGADMNYQLELVCSASTDCNPQEFPGGKCDCYNHPGGEQTLPLTSELGNGFTAAGEFVGGESGDIYFPAIEHPYRYDRVRLKYQYRNNEGKIQDVMCYNDRITSEGDKPPVDCSFDVLGGYFHCGVDVGERGYATFIRKPVPVKPYFQINDLVEVEVEVEKKSPAFNRDQYQQSRVFGGPFGSPVQPQGGAEADPNKQIPFFLAYTLRDHTGRVLTQQSGLPTSGYGFGIRLGREMLPIRQDGVFKFTLPKIPVSLDTARSSITGGQQGRIFDAQPYSNPNLEGTGPIEKRRMIGAAGSSYVKVPEYPLNTNLYFSVLMFKDKRGNLCYALESAGRRENTQGSYSELIDFRLMSTNELNDPPSRDCVDQSDLSPAQRSYLQNNVFLMQRDSIQYQGVQIYPAKEQIASRLHAAAFVYEAPQMGLGYEMRDCTAQNPLYWKLDLELLHCKPDETTTESREVLGAGTYGTKPDYSKLSADNCNVPSEEVVVYQGMAQQFVGEQAITIPIVCRDAPQARNYPSCGDRPDERLSQPCDCGGDICGEVGADNYCANLDGTLKCLRYEACTRYDPLYNSRFVEPTNQLNACDCNGALGLETEMECPTGNYCVRCPNIPDQSLCVDANQKDAPPACEPFRRPVAPAGAIPGVDPKDIFKFIIIGDSGVPDIKKDTAPDFDEAETTRLGASVAQAMEKLIALQNNNLFSFMIHNGNMINAGEIRGYAPRMYPPDSADKMWNLYKRLIVDPLSRRDKVIVPVPGWKDVTPNSPFFDRYATFWNERTASVASSRSGNYPYYYSFDVGKNHFVVLDTNKGFIDEQQKRWLEQDLEKLKVTDYYHTFIFSSASLIPLSQDTYTKDEFDEGALREVTYTRPVRLRLEPAHRDSLIALIKQKAAGKSLVLFTGSEAVYLKANYQGINIVSTGSIAQGDYLIGQSTTIDPLAAFVIVDVKGPELGISALSALAGGRFDTGPGLIDEENKAKRISGLAPSTISLEATAPAGLELLGDCQLTPQPQEQTNAVGTYNSGSLENGMQLLQGPYISAVRARTGKNYGTYELVTGLERASCAVFKQYNTKLEVGDLSRQRGGPLGSHGSHQNGLDVDVSLFANRNGAVSNSPWFSPGRDTFDAEINWNFVEAFVKSVPTYMIFLDRTHIDTLRNYAASKNIPDRERVLAVLRHEPGHADHFHIRVRCPVGDRCECPSNNQGCKATEAVEEPLRAETSPVADLGRIVSSAEETAGAPEEEARARPAPSVVPPAPSPPPAPASASAEPGAVEPTPEPLLQTTLRKWERALSEQGLAGRTVIEKLASNGHDDNLQRQEWGRETLIFAPGSTDFTQPVELMYYFHGLRGFGGPSSNNDFKTILAPQTKQLVDAGRNFVLVVPEMPWSAGSGTESAMQARTTRERQLPTLRRAGEGIMFVQFDMDVRQVIAREFRLTPPFIPAYKSMTAHSAGGAAMLHASRSLAALQINAITLADADYYLVSQHVWDDYVKTNPTVELNLLVQSPATSPDNTPTKNTLDFLRNTFRDPDFNTQTVTHFDPNVNYVPRGESHMGIAGVALVYASDAPPAGASPPPQYTAVASR